MRARRAHLAPSRRRAHLTPGLRGVWLRRYEQVINRLKQERLSFPAEIKALETTLAQKERDYEQLLLMSHDANHSKEVARQELSKFEMLVSEERKQREKELHDCRAVLLKKQNLATDLVDSERQRKQAPPHPPPSPCSADVCSVMYCVRDEAAGWASS